MGFVHLHLHTEYSLLDGACRIDRLLDAVAEQGQTAVAITDHGVMYGVLEFYKKAKAKGIKPIIGCEVYVARGSRFDKKKETGGSEYSHLILLCENDKGYENLIKMVSLGFMDGFYSKPRVDKELLKEYHGGLIALSACLAGEIPKHLLYGEYDKAKDCAKWYRDTFGENNFYLELQDHGLREQKIVNPLIVQLANETGIPLVATNDVHYVSKDDAKMQEVLIAIQTGKKVGDENALAFSTDEFYLKSQAELFSLFPNQPEAITNTGKIAERCNVEFEFGKLKLPVFDIGEKDHFTFFRDMCYEGIARLYGDNPAKEITDRLEYELKTIDQMGFVDYYLIVQDYVNFAKKSGIPVGPGRGSGAGSLAAYLVGITGIDPIKYDLLFERFLNPERVSMPDFDVDFCYVRRQEVIDYVVEKYGKEYVSQIVTFGTMAARAAVRDVGRALDVPYYICDRVAKLIPSDLGMTIEHAIEVTPELKESIENDTVIATLIDMAKKVEGMPRHASTHAAGVVISNKPVYKYVPLAKNDEAIVTQFTMTELEELGLLKMDFLGLRNLTVISDTVKMINRTNPEFTIETTPIDDKVTLDQMGKGFTEGVFQFESEGMKQVLRSFGPESLEDLIAIISLYRPGPRKSIPKYIYNRHHKEEITYSTPLLKPILDVTYGCIVYQEQVMQVFRSLAGYSLGRADIVRRAMSKKKHSVMEKERKSFIYGEKDEHGNIICDGAIARGVPEKVAKEIYDEISLFSSYAFNKSHAAAYALISYQTAYLKCYYKKEYMAALLTSVLDWGGKVAQYSAECARLGINILPPDVNESELTFSTSKDGIRFGLLAIKNLGQGLIERLISERGNGRYTSMYDFCIRNYSREFNRRALEGLIKSGAMDSLRHGRRQMLQAIDKVMELVEQEKAQTLSGQLSLFDTGAVTQPKIRFEMPDVPEMSQSDLLRLEKESTGLYLTGHPLGDYDGYAALIKAVKSIDILEHTLADGEKATIVAMISEIKMKQSKNGQNMAFLSAEDRYDSISVTVFPKTYLAYKDLIQLGNIVKIVGHVSEREDRPAELICDRIELAVKQPTSSVKQPERQFHKLYLKLPSMDQALLDEIKSLLSEDKGAEVIIVLGDSGKRLKASGFADFDEKSMKYRKLCEILGESNVKSVE